MDQAILSLNFHCRNARLCHKQANFCRKSGHFHDELSHLYKFQTLVTSTIPSHPQFQDKKSDKQVVELQICLNEAQKRIHKLELEEYHQPNRLLSGPQTNRSTKKVTSKLLRSCSPRTKPVRSTLIARSPRSIHSATDASSIVSSSLGTRIRQQSMKLGPSTSPSKPARNMAGSNSPTKKHQTWGTWTANPHDVSSNDSNSGLSPPSKRRIHSSPLGHDFKGSPALSDPRAEAIVGGCALLATHLQSFDERNNDNDQGHNGSPSSRRGERKKVLSPNEWYPGQHSKTRERVEYVEIPDGDQDETASSHISSLRGRRFRYAPDFFEKKFQEKRSKKTHHTISEHEETFTSSRISSEKKQEKTKGHQEKVQSVISQSFIPSSHNGRLPHLLTEDIHSLGLDQESNDMWARKFVPAIEQKLTHEILRSHKTTQIHDSKRKKHKQGDVLGMVDQMIRQAVDSDSEGLSNITSPCNITLAETSSKCSHPHSSGNVQAKHSTTRQSHEGQQSVFPSVQVEALEKQLTDLKESIEGFTSRVEEDGDSWQTRMQGLEKQMKLLRDDTDQVFLCIKGTIKDEIKSKLEDVTKGLDRLEKRLVEMDSKRESLKQRLESTIEDCATSADSLRGQMDSMISDLKINVIRDVKERIYHSVQDMKVGVKSDLDVLKLGMYKDIENLRKDLEAKLEATYIECEKAKKMGKEIQEKTVSEIKSELKAESERLWKAEMQEMEAFIEAKIHKKLLEPRDNMSAGKEKAMAEMKNQIYLLSAEVNLLKKGTEKIKDSVEELNHIAQEAKESINDEQVLLKTENASLKKQLQCIKKESMQTRADIEVFKKDMGLDMKSLRSTVGKMKEEGESEKNNMSHLNIKEIVERIMNETKMKNDKSNQDEYEMDVDGSDQMLIMERIEEMSKLYLGALEEIKQDLTKTKSVCKERIKRLEMRWMDQKSEHQQQCQQDQNNVNSVNALKELNLDGLETRISQLECKLEHNIDFEKERARVESVIVNLHKEREQAASILLQVEAASKKAEDIVSETSKTMERETENIRIQSLNVQDSLVSQKDAAAAVLAEVKRIQEHIEKEKESMVSHAKAKTVEAEAALGEILRVQRKSVDLSNDIIEARNRCTNEIEDHIEVMKKTLVDEVSKVRSQAEVLEEEKKKTLMHIEEWKKMMADDVAKARTALDGIEKEKSKSISMAEIGPFKTKEELEQHVLQTETAIHGLSKSIQQAKSNLDEKLEDMTKKQAELEEQDKHIKEEIQEVKDKMKNAIVRIDTLNSSATQLETEHVALEKSSKEWSQKYDAACRIFQGIENRLSALKNASIEDALPGDSTKKVEANVHEIANSEKQKLAALYKELSGILRKMRSSRADDTMEWPEDEVEQKFQTMEARIQQIESESLTSLRSLESKMVEISMTTQTALEGASLAESKCGKLGVELVKVFRMIASSRKGSPPKPTTTTTMMVCEMPPHQHIPANTVKAKAGLSTTTNTTTSSLLPCSFCKKASMKGSNMDPPHNLPHHTNHVEGGGDSSSIALHNKVTPDFKIHDRSGSHGNNPHADTFQVYSSNNAKMEGKRAVAGQQYEDVPNVERRGHGDLSPGKDRSTQGNMNRGLPPHHHQNEESSCRSSPTRWNTNQQANQRGGESGALLNAGQSGSDGAILKLYDDGGRSNTNPSHSAKKSNNVNACATTTTTHHHHHHLQHQHHKHSSTDKNCQSTNIRLETGKIQVNVSHRSAVLPSGGNNGGGRIMGKRSGDAAS